jgi:mRNA interferase RelE/StbE
MKAITYSAAARRSLRKLPAEVRARIADKLRVYAGSGSGDVKALAGRDGARLRVGYYRVVFVESPTEIAVMQNGHRRDIYR